MAAGRVIIPQYFPAEDLNGVAIPGAKLFFYADGTTTLAPTFTSNALTVQNTNPVTADSVGVFPPIWADTATLFTVALTDGAGVPIVTYSGVSAAIDATLASANLADIARAAAVVAQAAAVAAQAAAEEEAVDASDFAMAAAASATAAAASAALAQAIAGFDISNVQLKTAKGVANGYAGLDGTGKVPQAQLNVWSPTNLHLAVSGDAHGEVMQLATTADVALGGVRADDAGNVGLVNSVGAARLVTASDGSAVLTSDAGVSSDIATEDFAIAAAAAF